jgi:hypothetical protein
MGWLRSRLLAFTNCARCTHGRVTHPDDGECAVCRRCPEWI